MAYGMVADMEKTTVYLDPEQQRRLRALARRQGRPQAEVIREAIAEYLGRRSDAVLPSWVGIADTDAIDSTKVREYRQDHREELAGRRSGAGD